MYRIQSLNAYQNAAIRTDDGNTLSKEEGLKCWTLGLSGEVGEFTDLVKKHFYHGRPVDPEKALMELGDILWYLTMASENLGFTLEDVANANIEKLMKRYPNGFSHEASKNRQED